MRIARYDDSNRLLFLVAAIILGLLLRLLNVLQAELWSDEIFSVALAQSPVLDILLLALRFDVHPPIYYLQLHLWSLLSNSDTWFILNSVVLNLIAGGSIWWICRRLYGEKTSYLVLLVFALSPTQVFFSETVRMYAMAMIVIVWLWYVLELHFDQFLESNKARLVVASLLGCMLTLSHGIGFIVSFFIFGQAAVRLAVARRGRDLFWLCLAYLPVALSAAYPLVIGSIRQAGVGMEALSLPEIGIHLTIFLLGHQFPWPEIAGFGGLALLILPGLVMRRSRRIMTWLVAVPMLALLLISVAVQPIFLFRTLGLLSPFLIIGVALWMEAALERGRVLRALAFVPPVVFLVSSVNYSLTAEKNGFRGVSEYWASHAASDAVLFTSGMSDYWGVIRYLPGADPGSALRVQPPVRGGMESLKIRLEKTPMAQWGFFGSDAAFYYHERRILPFRDDDMIANDLERFWILQEGRAACPGGFTDEDDTLQDGYGLILCERNSP